MPRGTHENSKKNLKQGNPETQFTSGRKRQKRRKSVSGKKAD